MWGRDPNLFFWMWIGSCPSTICWKDCPFPTEWSQYPCWKSVDRWYVGLYLNSAFFSISLLIYMFVLMPVLDSLDYCNFRHFFLLALKGCLFQDPKKERAWVWFFSPDFAEPLTMPGYGGAASAGASVFGATGLDNQPPEETVAIITSMGFHRNQAIQALRATVSTRDHVNPCLFCFVTGNWNFPVSSDRFESCLSHTHYSPEGFINM